VQYLLAGRKLGNPRHRYELCRHNPRQYAHHRTYRSTIDGRLLASSGAVTMDSNTITEPGCLTTTRDAEAASASAAAASSAPAAASSAGSAQATPDVLVPAAVAQVLVLPIGAPDTGDGSAIAHGAGDAQAALFARPAKG
jgi:hypothetical protein